MSDSEEEYRFTLNHQRHMYGWCLEHVGGLSSDEAKERASVFYVYQAEDEPLRALVFHDDAWHWAMLHLFGEGYWRADPERAEPTVLYEREWAKFGCWRRGQ